MNHDGISDLEQQQKINSNAVNDFKDRRFKKNIKFTWLLISMIYKKVWTLCII